jgi:hypothetical protein
MCRGGSGLISFWVGRWGPGEEGCLGDALCWVVFVEYLGV